MSASNKLQRARTADADLRRRASLIIPGGMYGHLQVRTLPPEYPQFYDRADGSHLWDVDGNEYVDLMCSFGPIILGHRHPRVEAAVAAQLAKGDTMAGPGACMVEAAEILVDRVAHADWAMFAKNGSDATNLCLMIARAATGHKKVLMVSGAYHGWTPWCTLTDRGLVGIVEEDRANTIEYTFNDIASVERAVDEAGRDVAAIFISPFKSNAGYDNEMIDPAFARSLRSICDRIGAALVLDEVRTGFRVHDGGSWEPIGVAPDLSAWSKGIANGYALAAALGSSSFADAASSILCTGSFWFQSAPMAAAVATINAIRSERAVEAMTASGEKLRSGIEQLAQNAGVPINYTGAAQMPNFSFPGDGNYEKAKVFCATVINEGVIVHPSHNWFISAAITDGDIEKILSAMEKAFDAVRAWPTP